jgi:hypothetical protein
LLAAAICLVLPARADLIDFETLVGFSEGDAIGAIATATNVVTFGVSGGLVAPDGPGFLAEVGSPLIAFSGFGGADDTPAGGNPGSFFLTDEPLGGPTQALNYFISFVVPIVDLTLDLYDFRADGGAAAGGTATLQLFSDAAFGAPIGGGFDTFTIPLPNPVDGNVESLSVVLPAGFTALSALLSFDSPDRGTGIDNVDFTTAPEPWTVFLLGSGLLGAGALRRRRTTA